MSSDRIQILDRPVALPAHCVVCGFTGGTESDGRKFIDFNFDLDFYGAVIFCDKCFLTGINGLGYLSPEQALKLKQEREELTGKLQTALAENAKLRSALDSLSFLGSSDSVSSPVASDKSLPETSEDSEPDDNRSTKSTNKRGSKNIPDDDEVDDILGI